MTQPRYEKMSKSRGNVVLPEEVIYGVRALDPSCEFRDVYGRVVDWQEIHIWQDCLNSNFFFTATRHGRQPVFLHQTGNRMPSVLLIDGEEKLQHPDQVEFWYWKHIEQEYPMSTLADDIKTAIVNKVAEGNPALKDKIIEIKATEELERRKDLALKGLAKLEQLQGDLAKTHPDHIIRNENGDELQKGYTEKGYIERKRLAKNILDLQNALAAGLGEANWEPLRKIVGGVKEAPVVDNT